MPIQNNPPRQIGTAIQRSQNDQYAIERGQGAFNGITEEAITATNSDGSYGVANTWLFTSGVSQPINVGDIVKVGWRGGNPIVILSHTSRRAKFIPPPPVGGPIVEMLLTAPAEAPSSVIHSLDALDVYFRNASQTTLLNCRKQINEAGFAISLGSLTLVPGSWGLDRRSFLVQFTNSANSHPIIAVFHIAGSSQASITSKATASLVTTIDLGASGIGLGSMSWTQNVSGGFSATTPLALGTLLTTGYSVIAGVTLVQRASGFIRNACYSKNQHLIISVDLKIDNQPGGGGGLSAGFYFPYVIDVTAGTIIFNGIAQQGVWPTTIYNGAAFISVGAGFYDETGTGTNAWAGGAQLYLIPDSNSNPLRVFAGVRAAYTGGNVSLAGHVQQYADARDLATGAVAASIFPLTTYLGPAEHSYFSLLSNNSRYVMWMRASPGPFNGVSAFNAVNATTLAGYDFKEGIHITDLGTGKLVGATDYIPLTTQTDIESFLDQVPYLTHISLMWEDHNDMRVAVDPNSSVPSSRVAPEFVSFRKIESGKVVVIVPFSLPLSRLPAIRLNVSTLKAMSTELQFVVDMVNFLYLNSGHADMVVGYSQFNSPNSPFVCVQTINGPGATLPNK